MKKGIEFPVKLRQQCRSLIVWLVPLLCIVGTGHAADLSRAKGTVDAIRQADPPSVSTTTKPSPVGQPVTSTSKEPGYKPQQPSPESKAINVPSPVNKLNPTNDPDVQRGFDQHQKAHGK